MAAQPKFTPGPWRFSGPHGVHGLPQSLAFAIEGDTPQGVSVVASVIFNADEGDAPEACRADARLIAAAPDLYAALQRLFTFALVALRHDVDIPGFDPETHVDVKQARAALRKADGDGT